MPNETIEDAPTSEEEAAAAAARAAIRTFVTSVTAVERIADNMMQVTCAGGDLRGYEPLGPDDFVYVLAPPRGRRTLTINSSFTWTQYEQMAADERPIGAYYTVRRWRPEPCELDLVVVLHGDGDGAYWAEHVAPGDPVALWGPRRVYEPQEGTERFVLVGDETGVHAIAAILELLGPDARADVVVECDEPLDTLLPAQRPGVSVTWALRDEHAALHGSGRDAVLVDAVRVIAPTAGRTYAWGGGESRSMTAVRRYLRDERGFDQFDVAMTAYWRRDGAQP